jgi:hypothetical protein
MMGTQEIDKVLGLTAINQILKDESSFSDFNAWLSLYISSPP